MLINKLYNAPAFRLFLLFGSGIIAGKEIIFNPFIVLSLITASIIFILISRNLNNSSVTIVLSLVIILSGIAKSNYDFYSVGRKSLLNLAYNHPDVFLTGIVSDLPETGNNKIQFRLESEYIISADDTLEVSGDVLVIVRQTKEISDTADVVIPEAGDRVVMFGDLVDAPEDANPGEFDYRNYLLLNDIQKTFRVHFKDDIMITGKNNLGFLNQHIVLPARKYAIGNINSYIGGNEGAFLNGLVTGYRSDIPKEMKDDFVKAGVMHILAVSGLNVAYVILMLSFVLSMLRTGLWLKIILYLTALLFYTYFAGASASIIRAVIMGSLMVLVPAVQRKPNYYNIIGVSGIIILAIDSRQLFNPGFILTYASVLSIIFIMDRINYEFPSLGKQRRGYRLFLNRIFILMLSGLAAQIGVLPVTVFYFSKISISGIITNLAAIPLSNISLALGFFQIIAGAVSSFLCELIAGTNAMLLKLQLWFIHEMAAFGYSHAEFYGITLEAILLFYIVLLLIMSAGRKKIVGAAVASVTVILIYIIISGMAEGKLRITYLSLGNADCTHMETPDGSNILIDAGTENPFNHSLTKRVIPYLKYRRVKDIDLLVITSDIRKSYYAIKSLKENFSIKKIVYGISETQDTRIAELFSDRTTGFIRAGETECIKGFGGISINIIRVPDVKSFLTKIIYGSSSFLFTGTADKSDEEKYTELRKFELRSDILKIASHGNDKSSSAEFLKAVNPTASVISARQSGGKNTPSPLTLERLKSLGIRIFRTDTDNALIFESDGKTITLEK